MKISKITIFIFLALFFYIQNVFCELASSKKNLNENYSIDEIMKKIELKYIEKGFGAIFSQESTLKAMDITDKASGTAIFMYPGMMKWTYLEPEEQIIVTDGDKLWIYRKEDNQVMLGKAPKYFGSGKGASFLTDIEILRQSFELSFPEDDPDSPPKQNERHCIKLLPKKKNPDFTKLFLSISKKTYDIMEITSYNAYGDKTLIKFSDLEFHNDLAKDMFYFKIPDGADIVQLDGE